MVKEFLYLTSIHNQKATSIKVLVADASKSNDEKIVVDVVVPKPSSIKKMASASESGLANLDNSLLEATKMMPVPSSCAGRGRGAETEGRIQLHHLVPQDCGSRTPFELVRGVLMSYSPMLSETVRVDPFSHFIHLHYHIIISPLYILLNSFRSNLPPSTPGALSTMRSILRTALMSVRQ